MAMPAERPFAALPRCGWAGDDPLMVAYHDHEWGVPCRSDLELFERLILEGFQAGLSWRTVLHKRECFREAFDGFDPEIVAAYGDREIERLLADPGIIRNRLKVRGAVTNARAWLELREATGSAVDAIWAFAPEPGRPRPRTMADVPATTPESDAMSAALRKLGFTFVGSTICYAFMQSVGMVDDHVIGCHRAIDDTGT